MPRAAARRRSRTVRPPRRPAASTVSTRTLPSRGGRSSSSQELAAGEAQLARDRPSTRTITRFAPRAARPSTTPYDTWYAAGRSTTGGASAGAGGGASITGRTVALTAPCRYSPHVDLDAFFAAVEELEDPSLRSRPLVVGGDPHGRGVVATANYVARRFGIRSAMSSAEALRRCPEVIFLRPRHALYRQYSQAVWACVEEVVPRVERTGIDEGYLDLGSVLDSFAEARRLAGAVQVAVRGSTSLSCSLGVSTSKVVCKIASDRRKPGGITVVPPGREAAFLAPLATRILPGVGPRAEERLAAAGIVTLGGLASLSDAELRAVLPGQVGRLLRDRARGIDPRDLELDAERVSISTEETFERDLAERHALHAELRRMAEDVAEHLRRNGLPSGR